jgi:hypothetical protein
MHPDLYKAVKDIVGFTGESLMEALSYLVDNKSQATNFIGIVEQDRILWTRTYLAKYY